MDVVAVWQEKQRQMTSDPSADVPAHDRLLAQLQ